MLDVPSQLALGSLGGTASRNVVRMSERRQNAGLQPPHAIHVTHLHICTVNMRNLPHTPQTWHMRKI